MAFVSSFALPASNTLSRSALCGARLSSAPVSVTASVRMGENSAAIPFLPKPAKIPEDAPGYAGFDPIGFSNVMNFKFLQEAEIKHSRVCMLAVIGILVAEFYTFPWYSDAPKLAAGIHAWGVKQGCMNQLLLWTSFWEIVVGTPALVQMVSLGSPRQPGEYAFDPLGLGKTEAAFKRFQNAELVNGRLAMIAVGGLLHQEFLTGMTPIQQLLAGKFLP